MDLFDKMGEAGVEYEMHSAGLVIAALTEAALEHEAEAHRRIEEAGYEGKAEILDGGAARHLEPALSDGVIGGLYLRSERHVRPESLVSGLLDYLTSHGVDILENVEVRGLAREIAGGWRLDTSRGPVLSDSVVVSAGVWSSRLLKRIGVPMLIEGGKGCSITSNGRGTRPKHALKLAEAKVTCSPFAEGMRISGTLDLSGMDLALDRRRLRTVVRSAMPYLKDWRPDSSGFEWAGLRPLTPDSLPVIGPVPGLDRLYVATGHGQLGLTLAPATGAALATLVLEGRAVPTVEPFGLDRFGRTKRAGKGVWSWGGIRTLS
jgi:D-amino-acid dehydrogenase